MINYSIIIPHKNSAALLEYCLSTIPIRDDVQVIVVDDNSDPQKVDFDHFPKWGGAHYECYFTKERKGAGYARNIGLEHVQGKWMLFADADDYFTLNTNEIFDKYVDADADIVFFRTSSVMLFDRKTPSSRADAFNKRIDRYFQTGDETELRVRAFSPWGKLIKRNLIATNNIKFEEIRYSNDNMFAVAIGCFATRICVENEYLYVLTEQKESLCSDYCNKPGELEIRAAAFWRVSQFIQTYHYPIDKDIAYNFLNMMFVRDHSMYRRYFREMQKLLGISQLRMIWEQQERPNTIKRIVYSAYLFCVLL